MNFKNTVSCEEFDAVGETGLVLACMRWAEMDLEEPLRTNMSGLDKIYEPETA